MAHDHDPLRTTHDREHLHALLKDFDTVMLGTFETTGPHPSLRARPMHVAEISADCSLCFVTRSPSEKVDEAAAIRYGHVFAQSSKQFISMQGEITLSTDRARLRKLWSKGYEVWLSGPDDPHAVLMIFTPREAELWDMSGTNGLRFLFESARSLVTGDKQPNYNDDMHERVQLR